MITRYQVKLKRREVYYVNKLKNTYWKYGKCLLNKRRKYKLNNVNFYVNDRCNGNIYKNIYNYVGEYTCPQTRSMTQYMQREQFMKYQKNQYKTFYAKRRTRSMTKYLKKFHKKNFRHSDKSL